LSWLYNVKTGELRNPAGAIIGLGYSGSREAKNNPAFEHVANLGPLPRGVWTMGPADTHPELGPICIPLHPCMGTNTFARHDFFIHGDNPAHPRDSSHGCPVFGPTTRTMLALSTDRGFIAE